MTTHLTAHGDPHDGLRPRPITTFGQRGSYVTPRGYDMLAQAISGFLSSTGFPDHAPRRSGQSISDYHAGMLCTFSIVSALHYRRRTGKGQRIDLALLEAVPTLQRDLSARRWPGCQGRGARGGGSAGGRS